MTPPLEEVSLAELDSVVVDRALVAVTVVVVISPVMRQEQADEIREAELLH